MTHAKPESSPARRGGLPDASVAPEFNDPQRSSRLARAYPAVDAAFGEFQRWVRAPGVAYGVVVDGQLGHAGGFGVPVLGAQPGRVDPGTVFRIASMTKSVTAACVLMLRDEGRLALDEPVAGYLPELVGELPTTDSAPLTIRQLLTMSSGLVEDDPWADRQLAMSEQEFGGALGRGLPFDRPPATWFEYSNLGYAILGRVVARVAGRSAAEFATSRLFQPLEMRDTWWEVAEVPAERRARGYRLAGPGWQEEAPLAGGAFAPMGGLWTTIRDFSRYVAFQLAAWPARNDPDPGPLRRSSVREMQQASRLRPAAVRPGQAPSVSGYAFGLIETLDPHLGRVVSHSGGLPGFGSHIQWLPDHGVGVLGFANLTYAPVRETVDRAFQLLLATGELRAREVEPAPELVAARASVLRLYERWDAETIRSLAADNLLLDRSAELRQQDFSRLRDRHGPCRIAGPLLATGAQRGSWRMHCARGEIDVEVWLSPTTPPLVQVLRLTAAASDEGPPRT